VSLLTLREPEKPEAWMLGCRPIGKGAADHEVRRFTLALTARWEDGWRWRMGLTPPPRCPYCQEKLT